MPIIDKPIELSELALEVIEQKSKSAMFSHADWGCEELKVVRKEIREYYREIQRLRCVYCQNQVSARSAQGAFIEHIIPKSQNPHFMFEPKNLCVVCADCNEYKGGKSVDFERITTSRNKRKYPESSADYRIVHPHFDEYEDHILKANRIYVDRSEKGGYTIYICGLNRFFRRFGRCDEYVNDIKLVEESERLHGGY